ncbi:MAG: hypothetical protein IJW86_07165 [Clostridia bacterium]|nr:hypothetical protein [Clostridia bacterium]
MKDKLTFTLLTPHRKFTPMECDSVKLSIADSISGKFSGSYGIRKGHARAVLALAPGKISVSLDGQEIFSAESQGGFATVENNEVRVAADGVKENGIV